MSNHETIIRTGITCNKISCYKTSCATQLVGGLLLKMLKYFKVMLKICEFSHAKEIVESLLVYANKFKLMQISLRPIMFLQQDNKTNLVLPSFS